MEELEGAIPVSEETPPAPILAWAVGADYELVRAWAIYSPERSGWIVTRLVEGDTYFGRYEPGTPNVLPSIVFASRVEAAAEALTRAEAWLERHDAEELNRRADSARIRERIRQHILRLEVEVFNG